MTVFATKFTLNTGKKHEKSKKFCIFATDKQPLWHKNEG